MNHRDFQVVSASDRDYWEAFRDACPEAGETIGKCEFTYSIGGSVAISSADDAQSNSAFQTALAIQGRLFNQLKLFCASGRHVVINRGESPPFDKVSIRPLSGDDKNTAAQIKFIAAVEKRLTSKGLNAAPYISPEQQQFFQAQQAAIEKLTSAIAHAGYELEQSRSRLNAEFENREKAQQERLLKKEADLDHRIAHKEKQVDDRNNRNLEAIDAQRAALEEERKKLDDRNATHARRKHQEDIDKIFEAFQTSFGVTRGTTLKGIAVFVFTLAAIGVSGAIAYSYLSATVNAPTAGESAVAWVPIVSNIVKAVVFTAISVSLAIFLVNWLNNWFQRHADEEFRLKRLFLDIKRAVWFVETAREWTDKKDAQMPKEIVDRLTAGLFAAEAPIKADEPRDALANILLGAAKAHVSLPGGGGVDLDRAGIKKLDNEKK